MASWYNIIFIHVLKNCKLNCYVFKNNNGKVATFDLYTNKYAKIKNKYLFMQKHFKRSSLLPFFVPEVFSVNL